MKAATPPARASLGRQTISIHAAREGGDERGIDAIGYITISIHAAREGGDHKHVKPQPKQPGISIHAAREGGDNGGSKFLYTPPVFQSTPPVKAATKTEGFV